jgi:two-component system, sensor histidine kinase and response regulator
MGDRGLDVHAFAPHAILVVDDAPTNLVAYRAALESLGREIVTATSGGEAIQLLGRQQFSLLLIDVRMPGMDGFATVELLRGQLQRPTPVIFITGAGDAATMRRAYHFGAVDYLVKPVPADILRGKVRNLLALYDQAIELEKSAALLMKQHQRIAEADALLQRKDTNIGILAHDLRNPLAAIVTGLNLLGRLPETSERGHRTLERINRSALRMAMMIRDILDYTRGRLGGGIPLNREPTDLALISRSVVDEICAGHPTVHIEVETAGLLTGDWDAARIEQALSNLIANAVQHGGRDVRLIASGEEPDDVVVTVRNGGAPIPEAKIPTLFDGFAKGDDNPAGLGLGLFIVREIIQAHEGSVTVTSSAEGTAFTFRLPRRPRRPGGAEDDRPFDGEDAVTSAGLGELASASSSL